MGASAPEIIIRPADLKADALAIFEGAKDFIARMDYREFLPDNDSDLSYAIGFVLNLPGMEVLLAERDGEVVGGIGLLFAPPLWNPKGLVMDELFWWAAEDAPQVAALRLIRTAMRMAKKRAAIPSFRSLSSSPPGVDRLYRVMGLRPVETVYMGTR